MQPYCGRWQVGFSFLELTVVLVVLSLITTTVLDTFGPWVAYRARVETEKRLAEAHSAIDTAYRADAPSVEGDPGPRLVFGSGTIDQALPDANGVCQSTAATFAPVARFASASASVLGRDGSGAPLCVFVTPRQSASVAGTTLYYHVVAVVSPGENGVIESAASCATGLSATGSLSLCGDDRGVLLDGYGLALANFRATQVRIERVAAAYQAYYTARFQADPTRNPAVDYFANSGTPASLWDGAGAMPPTGTCAGPVPLVATSGLSPHDVLGLSRLDATDAYGNVMLLDNCSSLTRSPAQSDPSMRAPPYTARIETTLPGGAVIAQTAVGAL